MDGDPDSECLSVVARRRPLLERLAEGPARTSELAAAFDVSRSTIHRAVAEAIDADLVERTEGRYEITLPGALALEEFDRVAGAVADVVEAGDVLDALPADPALDPSFFADASVVARDVTGDDPAAAFESIVETATRQRAYLPADFVPVVETYPEAVDAGLECEFVLSSEALARLLRARRDRFAELLEADRVALREASTALPYGLAVSDGPRRVACVLLPGGDGLGGLVRTGRPRAVSLAEDLLEELRAEGSRVAIDADG